MNVEDKVISAFNKFVGIKIRSIKLVSFDYASMNYCINDSYIVRTPKYVHDDNINYKNELLVIEQLKETNINEKIIYYNKLNGLKISRIIHFFRNLNSDNETLFELIKTIKKIHCSNAPIKEVFDFNKHILFYKNHIKQEDYIDANIEDLIFKELKNKKEKLDLVVSHNNLEENKIFIQNNFIKIIDYRFATLNSPIYDLANISLILNLNYDEEKIILKKYFGAKNKLKFHKLLLIYKKYIILNLYYKNAYYFLETGETYYLLNKEKYKNYLYSL